MDTSGHFFVKILLDRFLENEGQAEDRYDGERQIRCFYADYRVYDVFEQLLTADLLEEFAG